MYTYIYIYIYIYIGECVNYHAAYATYAMYAMCQGEALVQHYLSNAGFLQKWRRM